MGRTTWVDGDGMKKGEWTAEEDKKLVAYINENGLGDWRALPAKAGLQRCGKSCRLRWLNYLRPGIKRGKFTSQEEDNIIKFHALLGNRWAAISKQMPNRTDNDIKNHWNSCLKKRLAKQGINPMTHEPILTVDVTSSSTASSLTLSPSPSSSPSSSSARLLNKLAARISSGKHGLELIKTVILSETNGSNEEVVEEMMIISKEEEEEAIGCVMEINEKVLNTTYFDELPCDDSTSTTSFVAFDDFLSIDPYGLCQSDFFETDLFLL